MTTAPVERMAIFLDIASEMNEPPNPKSAAKMVSPTIPCGSTPNSAAIVVNRAMTAMFVPTRSPMRVAKPPIFFGSLVCNSLVSIAAFERGRGVVRTQDIGGGIREAVVPSCRPDQ